jgi:hypothetical protein
MGAVFAGEQMLEARNGENSTPAIMAAAAAAVLREPEPPLESANNGLMVLPFAPKPNGTLD